MKRIIAIVLAMCMAFLTVPGFPVSAAEEQSNIEAAVTKGVETMIAGAEPGASSDDGLMQILTYALFGGGKDLMLTEKDSFGGMIVSTEQAKRMMIHTVTAAVTHMQASKRNVVHLQGSCDWYEHLNMFYYYDVYVMSISGMAHKENIIGEITGDIPYTGPLNSYDNAMTLVGGSVAAQVSVKKEYVTKDQVTYRVDMKFHDDFDFDGTYNGDDASIAKVLSWLGKLMQFGALVHSFHWETDVSFPVTINNYCNHVWEESSSGLVCTLCDYCINTDLAGTWETDLTIPASDFGVSGNDLRWGCTVTFGEDGTVSTVWAAKDISALRQFYFDMFAPILYECGYACGLQTEAEVDQLFVECFGMNVSDYTYSLLDSMGLEAMFTPGPTSGTYQYNDDHTAVYLDLEFFYSPSDPSIPAPFTVEGNTMKLSGAAFGMENHNFVCTRK